jgi:2-methylcitrate dehydratase PrpD
MALAALDAEALYDALRRTPRNDAAIAAFMAKIEVLADAELTQLFPQRWGSIVSVRWRSGHTASAEALEPQAGGGDAALGLAAVASKLTRIFAASGIPGAERIAALAESCAQIGERDEACVAAALLRQIEEPVAAAPARQPGHAP